MASVRLATLMAASAVGAAGLGASGTAGALLSRAISGSDAVAGLPLGLGVLGSGLGALLVTRLTMRISYPAALSVGYLLGACGAATVVASARGDNLGLLLLGSVFVGIANVAVSLTRYAAAEGATAEQSRHVR